MYNMQTSMRLGGGRVDGRDYKPLAFGYTTRKRVKDSIRSKDSSGNYICLGREYAKCRLSVDFNRKFTFNCFQSATRRNIRKSREIFSRKISQWFFSNFDNNKYRTANKFKKDSVKFKQFLCNQCFVYFNKRFLLYSLCLNRNEVIA